MYLVALITLYIGHTFRYGGGGRGVLVILLLLEKKINTTVL